MHDQEDDQPPEAVHEQPAMLAQSLHVEYEQLAAAVTTREIKSRSFIVLVRKAKGGG